MKDLISIADGIQRELDRLRGLIAESKSSPGVQEPKSDPLREQYIRLLSQLPDGYRERAIANLDPKYYNMCYPPENTKEALGCGWEFGQSPEKEMFWSKVYDHLEDPSNPLPPLPDK